MSSHSEPKLNDQVAIVTGAASDLGNAIATSLADCGADLVLVGRNTQALRPLAKKVEKGGRSATILQCDVTKGGDVRQMVVHAEAIAGPVDILVNVVGGTRSLATPIWETPEKEFTEILTLNLTTSFLTMAAVLPRMIERQSGRIINIGGTFGLRGRAERAAYSSAKWGLRGLTKSAALEAGPYNITVNCVCPGMIEGPQFDKAGAELAAATGTSIAQAKKRISEGYALRRASTPQDIADMVCFLASARARQITGQDLAIDGGWTI